MIEGPENPFRSPVHLPKQLPQSIRVRQIVGIGSYLVSAFTGFFAAASAVSLCYKWTRHQLSERDRILFEGVAICVVLALALGWVGYRLRSRQQGKTEWIVLLLVLLLILALSSD